jgi:hypothetical protein
VSLLPVFQWLGDTQWSIALHESLYMYPLLESVHVLTLCIFIGMTMMWDLRLLGWTLRAVPFSEISDRLMPWMRAGFIVMVVTGLLLVYAIPVRSYQSIWFRVKVVMLILAGLNAWLFHARVHPRVSEWDRAPRPPRAARIAGALSLALWIGIIVAGRMIAYNWFDCDKQPQPAMINTLAGCVIDSK